LDRRRLWRKTGTGRVSGTGSSGLEFGAMVACTGGIMKKIFALAACGGAPSGYCVTSETGVAQGYERRGWPGS